MKNYQEINEAGLGAVYSVEEEEDPIEFFGIVPEDHVDIEALVHQHLIDMDDSYNNQ